MVWRDPVLVMIEELRKVGAIDSELEARLQAIEREYQEKLAEVGDEDDEEDDE